MNWLKTLMILALLAQPLCAVACDLATGPAMDMQGQDASSQAAHGEHDCCGGDEEAQGQEPVSADHCGDCTAVATLTLAVSPPAAVPPGVALPSTDWRPGALQRAPKTRPPNA